MSANACRYKSVRMHVCRCVCMFIHSHVDKRTASRMPRELSTLLFIVVFICLFVCWDSLLLGVSHTPEVQCYFSEAVHPFYRTESLT